MSNLDLFTSAAIHEQIQIAHQTWLFKGFALAQETALLKEIAQVTAQSPFRQMTTPNGYSTSAALSNCGSFGWVSDHAGYRYQAMDPLSRQLWPAMPDAFLRLATDAASAAGFRNFHPNSCLINQYLVGAKLSLHQDKNELDFSQPIVSISLGISAIFLFGGQERNDLTQKIRLEHGDVMVWGGVDRLRYHGVRQIKQDSHPLLGERRINLTFRKAD
jgi:alkylated DNA repair protein (DNA oxidative demethylase)